MTNKEIALGRSFYDREAFFTWEQIKNDLPEARHIDLTADNLELRVFLFLRPDENHTVEFINFGLDGEGNMRDASYIMKNYYHIDYHPLEEADAALVWEKYQCKNFIDSGAKFDSAMSKLYDVILGKDKETE